MTQRLCHHMQNRAINTIKMSLTFMNALWVRWRPGGTFRSCEGTMEQVLTVHQLKSQMRSSRQCCLFMMSLWCERDERPKSIRHENTRRRWRNDSAFGRMMRTHTENTWRMKPSGSRRTSRTSVRLERLRCVQTCKEMTSQINKDLMYHRITEDVKLM